MAWWARSYGRALACVGALLVAWLVACSSAPSGGSPSVSGDDGGGTSGDDAPGSPTPTPNGDDAPLDQPDTAAPLPTGDDSGDDAADASIDTNPSVDLAPPPTLTVIAPTQALVGTAGPTITCTGTGFVPRSVVQVNGVPLATSFVSDTELRATIPTSNLATVGTLHVTVGTAPPGGGGSAEVVFQVVNPAPTITSLKPTSVLLGAADTVLTVTGASFVAGASVSFQGTALTTTLVNDHTVTATIPAASLTTSGTFPVTVTNPPPGGGTSSSIAFIVANPTVTITTVTPSTLTVGAPASSLALVGTGFVAASLVSFNGTAITTTFVDATHLGATVPASALTNAGDFPVSVANPAPGGGVSTPVTVHVVNPTPTATSLSPASILVGAPPPTITVTGTGFAAGLTSIALDGAASLTTVIDATHVSTTLTTAQVSAAHAFQVTVSNPSPGGGTSAPPLTFSVNDPVPTATKLTPASTLVGSPDTTVTVTGTGFVATSSVLLGSSTALATTFVNATTLTAVLPAANLAATGTLSLSVSSPAPGGGTTSPLAFTVGNPAPVATSVSPSFAAVGAPDTTVTIAGSAFVASSKVLLGASAIATTFVDAKTLTAVIPAASLAAAASLSLAVSTPAPGGGTSASLAFTVDNPGPTITLVSPSSAVVPAGADVPIAVTGTGFVTGASVVQIGGVAVATTYPGSALAASVPAAQLATAGTLSITVANPSPGGGTSNVAFFTANDPSPVITSLNPTSLYAGASATALTITGTGFVAASTASANGTPLTITAQTSTSLTATLPASLLAAPGTLSITVTNPAPGGGTSASATVSVTCNVTGANVVLSALSTPQTVSLSFTGAPTAYRITTSELNDLCPSSDDTTATQPYLGFVVVNDTAASATLSAWAVCTSTNDAFLTFYDRTTVPTTQSQLEACTGYVAEGASGAGAHTSPESGGSSFCPGLTLSGGDGHTLAACAKAVVLVQPYSTTSSSYTPPSTLKVELQ